MFRRKNRPDHYADAALDQFARLRDDDEPQVDEMVRCTAGFARRRGGHGRQRALLGLSDRALYVAQGPPASLAVVRLPLTAIAAYEFASFTPNWLVFDWAPVEGEHEFRECVANGTVLVHRWDGPRARAALEGREAVLEKTTIERFHQTLMGRMKRSHGM